MSGSERKKYALRPGGRGWEEAGGEFYQECYPGIAESELEIMQNDPHRISTLLPSKKSRTNTIMATTKKDQKPSTLRHRTTIRSNYQTTVGPNNDIQISLLPDLSENLSNEQLLWEEIMKIKAMPIGMAQKKEMKAKLLSRDTLRLQGFEQFKWKRKQGWMQFKVRLNEWNEKLTLWGGSMKKIEGYYGTGVVSYFMFVKWMVFLNLVVAIIVNAMVVVPTVYTKYTNRTVDVCGANGPQCSLSWKHIWSILDTKTPLFYSYYDVLTVNLGYIWAELPPLYVLTTLAWLAYSLGAMLKNAASCVRQRLLESEGQFYAYCDAVFAGWDWCVRRERTARIKRRAVYNELVGRLNVDRRRAEQRCRSRQRWCKLVFMRIVMNIAVVALLAVAGIVIFTAFTNMDFVFYTWYGKLLIEFTPVGCIVFFNIALPFIFRRLVAYEHYSPSFVVKVTIIRTITLRYASLCVLLAGVYDVVTRVEPKVTCWESYLAQELYKLLALNLVAQVAYTFLLNFPRSLLAKRCKNKVAQYLGRQEFYLPGHVLDVVYVQTIIWMGTFYAPTMPALGVVLFVVMFYIKKFACLVNCKPAADVYYASRSHSFYMLILLMSFGFSVAPLAYSIAEIQPSKTCGPFVRYDTVWSAVRVEFERFPEWLNGALAFGMSSPCMVPVFVLLMLANYYYYAVYAVNKQMVLELKKQLVLEGHDKQFLLDRLSAFIRQHHRVRNLEPYSAAVQST